MKKTTQRNPWAWIPSLYFAEGIPYVIVMTVSVIMYKRMGISNANIALYTSWLYLPWIIKPLWSPVVDMLKTKRWWIVVMQLFIGAGLAGVAFTIPVPDFFQYTLAFFWLLAFSSATHDIAADGFYMLGLNEHKQAYFVGIRSTFYRFSMITGQGLLIIVAGALEVATGLEPVTFSATSSPTTSVEYQLPESPIVEQTGDDTYFVVSETELIIPTQPDDASEINRLKSWASDENIAHGFVQKEAEITQDPSWWSNHVANPLKTWLKARFSTEKEVTAVHQTGNIGLVGIHLSQPPAAGEEIVLNIGRQKGDKSIQLKHGERLTFTSENWDQNAWVVVQLDPKLQRTATTHFMGRSGNIPLAWSITFFILAALFALFFIYHKFILPRPHSDCPADEADKNILKEFFKTFGSFFKKENIGIALAFLLTFRLGESQLVKMASLFLLDSRKTGGLGLTTGDVGIIYGTIGILFLTIGGILGGWVASRKGLKYWLWWMVLAINLPNLVYVYLSYATPESFAIISGCVAIEQFGYGFGFTAYMLYMIYISEGKSKTAHFAICTGFMALGMMIPGMVSGWLQEIIGYRHFFIWVMICTLPGFLVVKFLKVDAKFGIKRNND